MGGPDSTTAAVEALLAAVAADCEARRREILGPAQAAAQARVAAARDSVCQDLRRAFAADRAARQAQLEQSRARLNAARRERHQRLAQAAAGEGLASLASALAARWRDPPRRQRWIDAALALAGERLPAGAWSIRHAPGPSPEEIAATLEQLASRGVTAARCELHEEMAAGIEIRTGEVRLDASSAGLLADRAAVLGRLLYFWGAP